jgi:AraC-like DNA-binding protein
MARTFGTDLVERTARGVTVIHAIFAPDQALPDHGHSNLGICSLLIGDICTDVPTKTEMTWQPLSAVLDPNDEIQGIRVGPAGMSVLLAFFEEESIAVFDRARTSFGKCSYKNDPLAQQMILRLHRSCQEPGEEFAEVALEFLAEFDPTVREEQQTPRWLSRAAEIVNERYRGPIGLTQVALEVGIDPTHLARTFRRKYGRTISEYIRVLRVNEAARLILEQEMPTGTAALEAGFCDHAHFTRAYKELIGSCPKLLKASRLDVLRPSA